MDQELFCSQRFSFRKVDKRIIIDLSGESADDISRDAAIDNISIDVLKVNFKQEIYCSVLV